MSSRNPPHITLTLRSFLILLLIQVLIIFVLVWPNTTSGQTVLPTSSYEPTFQEIQPSSDPQEILSSIPEAPTATQVPPLPTDIMLTVPAEFVSPLSEGWLVLALNDGAYTHLFAYQPQTLPLTRLTSNPWDDRSPAISPDGTRVVFSSRQNGYWDIFVLDLNTGQQTRITDTAEYDGAPSWSPDGSWLVYETYSNNNLELFIRSIADLNQPPIQLTQDPAADFSPSWSPLGRQIAFISNRSGEDEIWVADLDKIDDRFRLIAPAPKSSQQHPVWSPDGNMLAWSSTRSGATDIFYWDSRQPDSLPLRVGTGSWPVWSPSGSIMISQVEEPNRNYLSAYPVSGGNLLLPPVVLPGMLHGLDWKASRLPDLLAPVFLSAAQAANPPLWIPEITPNAEGPADRLNVVPIADVDAPYPYLHDRVDEAFQVFRSRLSQEAGWDILGSLENAYVPLTSSLPPGMTDDWLYTGRAFTFNTIPVTAGWMAVVREEFSGQTYWRVYLKSRYQDGSQGMPLHLSPWDFNARSSGNPQVYEQGGRLAAVIPSGYWVDLTDLANRYGWERQPALVNWRTYFQGARFNELAITEGLDWRSALMQLYPAEIFITSTPMVTPTYTPTPLPTWYKTRIPTLTVTPSVTPTRRPTWTPLPPNTTP